MREIIEEAKEYLVHFPRSIKEILFALALTVFVSWAISGFFIDAIPSLSKTLLIPGALKIGVTIIIAACIYLAYDLSYQFMHRNRAIRLQNDYSDILRNEARHEDCSEIRIFASAGEDSKIKIIHLAQEKFKPSRRLSIKVLLRSDGTHARHDLLKMQADKWRRDIDNATKGRGYGYEIETYFSIYEHPVMLKGFIFGSRCALLAWYSKSPTFCAAPALPLVVFKSNDGMIDTVIDQAIKTFDDHFDQGDKL